MIPVEGDYSRLCEAIRQDAGRLRRRLQQMPARQRIDLQARTLEAEGGSVITLEAVRALVRLSRELDAFAGESVIAGEEWRHDAARLVPPLAEMLAEAAPDAAGPG